MYKERKLRYIGILLVTLFLTLFITGIPSGFAAEGDKASMSPQMKAIFSSGYASGKLLSTMAETNTNTSFGSKSTSEQETKTSFFAVSTTMGTVPQLQNISLEQTTGTIGEKVSISATVLTENPEHTYIDGRFKSPSGRQYAYFTIWFDEFSNTWMGELYLEPEMASGTWTLDFVSIYDAWTGNFSSYGYNDFPNATFVVDNPNYDGITPELLALSISPNQANVGDIVTINAEVTDNGVGTNSVVAEFYKLIHDGSDESFKAATVYLKLDTATGNWVGEFEVDQFISNGKWILGKVTITDSNWVATEYNDTDFPGLIVDVNNTLNSGIAPEVTEATLNKAAFYPGDTFNLEVRAFDPEGVGAVTAWFTNGHSYFNVSTSYDTYNQVWRGSHAIDQYTQAGTWTLEVLIVEDIYWNSRFYAPSQFPNLVFTVENSGYENIPPFVNSIEVSPKIIDQYGNVNVTIDAYDESGISYMQGIFTNQDGTGYAFVPHHNSATGKWEALAEGPWHMMGEHYLSELYVEDNFGNSIRYSINEFPSASFLVDNNLGNTVVKLNPSVQEVKPGERFTVYVDVENVSNLYGVEARINYDPSILTVVDADSNKEGTQIDLSGVVSGLTAVNQVNNGEIWFSTAKQGDQEPYGFTGSGRIATITFEVLPGAVNDVYIDFQTLQLSNDSDPPSAITTDYQGAYINIDAITGGTIEGQVRLQGLYYNDGAEVWLEGTNFTTLTDMWGYFRFDNLPEGNYNVVVKSPWWKQVFLTAAQQVYVVKGQNSHTGQILMRTGDINSDNMVNLPDLSRMALAYGAFWSDFNYNSNADLNSSSEVELFDLVLMSKNWNRVGYGSSSSVVGSVYGQVMALNQKVDGTLASLTINNQMYHLADTYSYLNLGSNEIKPATSFVSAVLDSNGQVIFIKPTNLEEDFDSELRKFVVVATPFERGRPADWTQTDDSYASPGNIRIMDANGWIFEIAPDRIFKNGVIVKVAEVKKGDIIAKSPDNSHVVVSPIASPSMNNNIIIGQPTSVTQDSSNQLLSVTVNGANYQLETGFTYFNTDAARIQVSEDLLFLDINTNGKVIAIDKIALEVNQTGELMTYTVVATPVEKGRDPFNLDETYTAGGSIRVVDSNGNTFEFMPYTIVKSGNLLEVIEVKKGDTIARSSDNSYVVVAPLLY